MRLLISSYIITAALPGVVLLLDRMAPGHLAAQFAALALPALLALVAGLLALLDPHAPRRGLTLALAAPIVVLPCLVIYILGACLP